MSFDALQEKILAVKNPTVAGLDPNVGFISGCNSCRQHFLEGNIRSSRLCNLSHFNIKFCLHIRSNNIIRIIKRCG